MIGIFRICFECVEMFIVFRITFALVLQFVLVEMGGVEERGPPRKRQKMKHGEC